MTQCGACVLAKSNAYYARNRDRIREKARNALNPYALDAPITRERHWLEEQRQARKRELTRVRDRNKNHRRRAKTRHNDVTPADMRALLASRTTCPLCAKRMTDSPGRRQKHVDHIVPVNIGGTHTIGNLRVICRACNLARPTDGSDLDGHMPTLWATDERAAQAAAVLRAVRAARPPRPPTVRETKAQGRKIARRTQADLAYLFRLNGATWAEIADRFGFANSGHAHNVVYGGDHRSYAPGRLSF